MTTATSIEPVELAERLSGEFLLHHRLCPLGVIEDGSLAVAITEESLLAGLDDLSVAYNRRIVTRPSSPQELDLLIARLTSADEGDVELGITADPDESFISDVRQIANQPPVVRYVNLLLREGYENRASDVHLESTPAGLDARYRIDGVLQTAIEPPGKLTHAVISRVKLLADLDIAEQRRPQDGRFRVRLKDRELDVRVSTVPTIHGESVVLRLLERGGQSIALQDLGLDITTLTRLERIARQPSGLIIATGPTGSGKTTTLYAALGLRDATREKIITVEDPVEYALPSVTQVPVKAKTGVTFSSMLRSILRQDPDVVLVGEMRDTETAELAVRAALTGHAVFSTLHTNDAVGAIPRLLDLGIAPYLIAATLRGVLSQRLVRTICNVCRELQDPPTSIGLLVGGTSELESGLQLTRGRGCPACRGSGFRGRTGVFELLEISDELREAIVKRSSRQQLERIARDLGMVTMREDGGRKIREGLTTAAEVLRVTQD